ncbi:toll/interleukin-1 receptor domain-containing protein [Streptomyces sp. JV176]|uniref:toll/interleukin-1 receptor domain-containing protein n=1 Tax=Streptomyces sp. JV176 TaxID=858630 RepID=UPI002E78F93E|nr:toll/interleukin-1 receptor domain-containing protein [Streptomyces sp. JV176]MEE1803691.1 toll/interleukin-1 receptor domain-containing protein [Streptomyces sp. JV176]
MHEIFINYRTQGGKEAAYICYERLSARFGEESVFLAAKSIEPGRNYVDALIAGAHGSRVLLALIDENWLDAPDPKNPGKRALVNRQDWVRREIEEALSSGTLVVPIMIGRGAEQLNARRLPKSLAELAECQYERLSLRALDTDMARLGDRLVRQVPELATLDRRPASPSTPTPAEGPGVHNNGQSGGIGQVGGSVGTFVNEAHGPLHTGDGNQFHKPKITGDGNNLFAGSRNDSIRQEFGTRSPRGRRDDER